MSFPTFIFVVAIPVVLFPPVVFVVVLVVVFALAVFSAGVGSVGVCELPPFPLSWLLPPLFPVLAVIPLHVIPPFVLIVPVSWYDFVYKLIVFPLTPDVLNNSLFLPFTLFTALPAASCTIVCVLAVVAAPVAVFET